MNGPIVDTISVVQFSGIEPRSIETAKVGSCKTRLRPVTELENSLLEKNGFCKLTVKEPNYKYEGISHTILLKGAFHLNNLKEKQLHTVLRKPCMGNGGKRAVKKH